MIAVTRKSRRAGLRVRALQRLRRAVMEPLELRQLLSVDMVTSAADSGPGSLRATVGAAASGDTIDFASGIGSSITLTTGAIQVSQNVSITGPGASQLTIHGDGASVFEVAANYTASISGITITGAANAGGNGGGIINAGTLSLNNCTITGDSAESGGGVYNTGTLTATGDIFSFDTATANGGAIAGIGTLTVIDGSFYSNTAAGGGAIEAGGTIIVDSLPVTYGDTVIESSTFHGDGASKGGGVFNYGQLTITGSTFTGETASSYGGGAIYNYQSGDITATGDGFTDNTAAGRGGAIDSLGTLTVNDGTFTDNSGTYGGAIESAGTTIVGASTFEGDGATISGGGIFNNGILTITQTSFTDETAGSYGGGGVFNYGNAVVTDSTFNGDTTTGDGGGLVNGDFSTTNITNSTFAYNQADSGGSYGYGGAIAVDGTAATVTIGDTTIADNSAYNGGGGVYIAGDGKATIYNTIISQDTSTYGSSDLAGAPYASTDNIIGANANLHLSKLGNYGGPTETIAISGNSTAAIDQGSNALAVDSQGNPLVTDQRGDYRVVGSSVDIGAYEYQAGAAEPGNSLVVTTLGDGVAGNPVAYTGLLTLRQAVGFADFRGNSPAITFSSSLFVSNTQQTISLSAGTVDILNPDGAVTIQGPVADQLIISGAFNGSDGVFFVGLAATANISSLEITSGNANSESAGNSAGGAIYNLGTLTVSSIDFADNVAISGGAVANDGVMTINNSTFTGNTALNGGAIANDGDVLYVNSSSLTGNSSTSSGGAVFNEGTLYLNSDTISNNESVDGGAIAGIASININGGVISNNGDSTTVDGGAIDQQGGGLTIIGAAFSDNTAAAGGAIYGAAGTAVISGTTFTGDQATGTTNGGGGAIFDRGILEVTGSTFTDESSKDTGGAIASHGTDRVFGSSFISDTATGPTTNSYTLGGGGIYSSGSLVLDSSTFLNDTTTGGAYGAGIDNDGLLVATNDTLADNNAGSGSGGGIYNNGVAAIVNSTFAYNSAAAGGGIDAAGAAGESNTSIYNTIVALNTSSVNNSASDIAGTLDTNPASLNNIADGETASASNLIGTGGSGGASSAHNKIGVTNPYLSQPGNYGGPTETVAPLPGSPAIEAGNPALALDSSQDPLTTDQRGQPRYLTVNSVQTIDIGAVETGGYKLEIASGSSPQTAPVGSFFGNPLAVTVVAVNGLDPVNGGVVGLTYPAGNTASLSNLIAETAVVTDADQAYNAQANGDVGSYAVQATLVGAESVSFSLTNVASTTISTTPSQTSVALGASSVTLTDTATLSGGVSETGTITFTLIGPGSTLEDTETVSVSGNGNYTTPTGYTLPASGAVTGVYQWDASYSGDTYNGAAADNNNVNERVTVSAAGPTIGTTPSQTSITLGATSPILTDTATLSGGYNERGTITFTLIGPGSSVVDTETVSVSGNGSYSTPTGYTLPGSGSITGAYQWDASYSGDANNSSATDNGNANEQVTVSGASPAIATTPSVTSVTLGTGSPTLKDTAVLSGGYDETGTITFTLIGPGSSVVDTETAAVSGNGSYSTPAGYTLPASGTAAGGYQWDASYSGDANNSAVSENSATAEQVAVSAASPAIVTAPSVTSVTLGSTSPTLTDTAVLSGGYDETGTITFKLIGPGSSVVDTETVSVSGNGSYSTPTGYTLPASGSVTGTYQWDAAYSGDTNNNAVSENNSASEQVTVSGASPAISTTPNPTSVTLGTTPPTLTDTSVLSSGYAESGSITFTLYSPSDTVVDTETVSVSGNGSYSTPTGYTLPTSGSVTGTYQWDASYSGDANNAAASENGATAEQVTVSPAAPTVAATPSPASATLGTTAPTLNDTVTLNGGYFDPGTITFTLYSPGNVLVDTETVAVTGNGNYSTPTGYTLPTSGTVVGTYQWDVSYSGDTNNTGTSENNATSEQVVISPASPTISTTPGGTVVIGSGTDLTDSASLAGGYYETGTITFTLYSPSDTVVDTETVSISGNGIYSTPTGFLPSMTAAAGTYEWAAAYSGDSNNNAVSSPQTAEPEVVQAATPFKLVYTQEPTSTTTNTAIAPAVTVAIEDQYGNILTTDDGSISMAINTGPGGAVLSGTSPVNAVNGVATFSDLSLNDAGSYTLVADDTTDSLTKVSTGFNINSTVSPDIDLSVSKTVSSTTPNVGSDVTYTVTLSNASGYSAATNVSVTDALPGGESLVSQTPANGTTFSGGVWNIPTLASGASVTLTYVAEVTTFAAQTNTAQVSPTSQTDVGTNLSSTVTVNPQEIDLTVTKSAATTTPNNGAADTFTVTVSNATGYSTATNVILGDSLPAGETLVAGSASVSTGTLSGTTWTIPTLAAGASATFVYQATVTGTFPSATPPALTDTASVTSADQPDANSNPSASLTVDPQEIDLTVTKSAATLTPSNGAADTFTVTVSNATGYSAAQTVILADTLPSGEVLVAGSASVSTGTLSGTTWTIPSLAAGASATFVYQATVTGAFPSATPPALTDTATVTSAGEADVNSNPSASVTVCPQEIDLTVTKSAATLTPNNGAADTFTVTVANATGYSTAKTVILADTLPSGEVLVAGSALVSTGTLSGTTWTIPSLAAGSSATFAYQATVTGTFPSATPPALTDTATVTSAGESDVNSNPSASVTVCPQEIDLTVTKSAATLTPNNGAADTFTVTVSNATGYSTAKTVILADTLPGGEVLVAGSASVSTGTLSGTTWTIPSLAAGASATFVYQATVTGTFPSATQPALTDTASVTSAGETDANSNASASVTVDPQEIDLTVTKSAATATPNNGAADTFTVTVSNATGYSTAKTVTLTDTLPSGEVVVAGSASVSAGTISGTTWTIPTLAAGATVTLVYQATVTGTFPSSSQPALTDTASATGGQLDVNSNPSASATVYPQEIDLSVTKTVNNSTPNVGSNVTYTVTVSNAAGYSTGMNLSVTDMLPSGESLVSASAPAGTTFSGGVWSIPTLAAGASATLTYIATVNSSSAQTNTASINLPAQTDVGTKLSASVTVNPVVPQIDLSVVKTESTTQTCLGNNVVYTVKLSNAAGYATATGVTVSDMLPTGLTFVSASPSVGTYSSSSGVWSVSSLAGGSSATLTVTAKTACYGVYVNTATVSGAAQTEVGTQFSSSVTLVVGASLTGEVYVDANGDCQLDNGESGAAGVTVELINSSGKVTLTTTTNSSGDYSFLGVAPGAYQVEFIAASGYIVGCVNGSSLSNCNNNDNGCGNYGNNNCNNNNNNGCDSYSFSYCGQHYGYCDGGQSNCGYTYSSCGGSYSYTYCDSGNSDCGYYGWQCGGNNNCGNNNDCGNGGSIGTGCVTLVCGTTTSNFNVGIYQPGTIGDYVWLDNNGNGLIDSGESRLCGIKVELLSSTGNSVLATTTTNSQGYYSFTNLAPGQYVVQFFAPCGDDFTTEGVGSNGAVNSSANPSNGKTGVIALASGETDNDVNAGLYQPACVSGSVYVDYANNGQFNCNDGDVGLSGITVVLLNGSGSVVQTTTTACNGGYTFNNVGPGTYSIYVAQSQAALTGFLADKDSAGTVNGNTDGSVTSAGLIGGIALTSGSQGVNYNFGETAQGQTLTCGETGSLAFWCSTAGTNLLNCLNGGSSSTNLGNWLAKTYANLYGTTCGSYNLSNKTNVQICTVLQNLNNNSNLQCSAEVLTCAINCYVTDSSQCGTVACNYGFGVCAGGCGDKMFSVWEYGQAFGVSNNTVMSVDQIVLYCNSKAVKGNLYAGNSNLQNEADAVFTAINQAGDIGADDLD